MNRLRSVLAALLVAGFTAPLVAAPVELKDLTQDALRTRAGAYLASPANAKLLTPLSQQLVLRGDQLHYTAVNGVPQKLEWRYQMLPTFDAANAAETQAQLKVLLTDMLSRFDGGMLSARDAQFLLARTSFVGVPGAGVAKMPPKELTPGAPPAAPTTKPAPSRAVPSSTSYYSHYSYGPGYGVTYPPGYWYYGPTWNSGPYGYTVSYQWRYVTYPWQTPMPQYAWQYPWYAAPWYAYPWWTYQYAPTVYTYRGY